MIGRITGVLAEKQPPHVLVDVGGIGYEIDVPMSTFYNLPASGERITLYTHLTIREDAHLLYGFGTEAERQAFRHLLKVSGIGAKTALSVLSGMSVTDLANAIAAQETGASPKCPASAKKRRSVCYWSYATNFRQRLLPFRPPVLRPQVKPTYSMR